MFLLSFSPGYWPAVLGWFTVKSSFRKAPVVPLARVGGDALQDRSEGGAEVLHCLAERLTPAVHI
jgi:hypothetical protein